MQMLDTFAIWVHTEYTIDRYRFGWSCHMCI